MTDHAALSVEDMSVTYTTPDGSLIAVDHVSLDVRRGEIFGIVGESGCGKTSLGSAVLGLLPGSAVVSGGVQLAGIDASKLSPAEFRGLRGSTVSLVPQDALSALDPTFSVGSQIVEVIRSRQQIARRAARQQAIDLLEAVGIEEAARRFSDPPHRFSGGMRQRVCIAIALANQPEVVIADEPTTALDVTIQKQILDLLVEQQRTRGLTLVLITHDLGVVNQVCDRVGVMYAGQLVEVGETRSVLSSPAHPYTCALLQSLPRRDLQRGDLRVITGTVPDMHEPLAGCRFRPRCPDAMEICSSDPPVVPLGSVTVRCWLATGESPHSDHQHMASGAGSHHER